MNQEYYFPLPSLEEICHGNLYFLSPKLRLFALPLFTSSEPHCIMLLDTALREAQLRALSCILSVEKQGT